MKKIAVVTSTRAEYGLLSPIIQELRTYENENLRIELIVTGTHLYPEYGMTVNEIYKQGIRIDHKIKIPVDSLTANDISNNQAQVLIQFTSLFTEQHYNAVLILGDRYEMLAVAIAASNTRTPIFHISGGDVTEGAIDDCIRHSITKMSYLHFTTNEDSRRRVIQLGEDPKRVFNFGSTSIDNVLRGATLTKSEAMQSVGIKNVNYALCTYHPVTLGELNIDSQIEEFLSAIKAFPEIDFIVTKSNADQGGERINILLDRAENNTSNLHVFASLGIVRYLSLMKFAQFVLGNSSSGIVEAPAFHIPTVNIGDRQAGRLGAESVINCDYQAQNIIDAINYVLSPEMIEKCKSVISPYGNGNAAKYIAKKIIEMIESIDIKKRFFDIEVCI